MGQELIVKFLLKNKGIYFTKKELFWRLKLKSKSDLSSLENSLKKLRKYGKISYDTKPVKTPKGFIVQKYVYWLNEGEYQDIPQTHIEQIPYEDYI